jgi:hypothetical protein
MLLYGSLHGIAGDLDHPRVADAFGGCSIRVGFDEG